MAEDQIKKDRADFVVGDFAAEETGKIRGKTPGGEVDLRPPEVFVGPAAYEREQPAEAVAEEQQEEGTDNE